jgi:hypothetical protein
MFCVTKKFRPLRVRRGFDIGDFYYPSSIGTNADNNAKREEVVIRFWVVRKLRVLRGKNPSHRNSCLPVCVPYQANQLRVGDLYRAEVINGLAGVKKNQTADQDKMAYNE